jgi:hypothetical protein
MSNEPQALKPIILYDHLPGILAAYPAILFGLIAFLSLFAQHNEAFLAGTDQAVAVQTVNDETPDEENSATESGDKEKAEADSPLYTVKQKGFINPHVLFWIGLAIMIVWYIAFRFNLPKSKFWMLFGLMGTFVGIPIVLEFTGYIRPFTWSANVLGRLMPEVNAGAWFAMSLVFFVIWLGNFIWSRTHLRVRIDESGLTVNRLGGKGERFELIGLKTENEPLDYLELFLAGVGSLSLKTRMNKPIFTMKRVIGLYRVPFMPFLGNKLAKIEEMLSYQGKVVSVDKQEAAEMADAEGDSADEENGDHDDVTSEEGGNAGSSGSSSEMN